MVAPETVNQTAWVKALGAEITYVDGQEYRTRTLCAGGGDEPPVILVHGVGGHVETYLKNVVPLANALENRGVYAIDMIGHGFSSKPGSYTPKDYAAHIEDVVSELGFESAHIHGESLGGVIATWIGINRPDLAESIGLNTTARIDDSIHETVLTDQQLERKDREMQDLFARTREMMDAGFPRELVARRVDWLFYDKPPEEVVDIRYNIYQRDAVQDEMSAIYGTEREMFVADDFRSIDVPTLVVHSDHNPGTPWQTVDYIHEELLSNSEFHVYENSAHWPQWERADLFNKHTAAFIESHGRT